MTDLFPNNYTNNPGNDSIERWLISGRDNDTSTVPRYGNRRRKEAEGEVTCGGYDREK